MIDHLRRFSLFHNRKRLRSTLGYRSRSFWRTGSGNNITRNTRHEHRSMAGEKARESHYQVVITQVVRTYGDNGIPHPLVSAT
jgi:hypothetical protein